MVRILTLAMVSLASLYCGGYAAAQTFPMKPIRIVVGFVPGATGDIFARILASMMESALGQPVSVDNIPDPIGVTGVNELRKSAPDGHTLLLWASTREAHLRMKATPVAHLVNFPIPTSPGKSATYGIVAPAGTPARVINLLAAQVGRALDSDEARSQLARVHAERAIGSPWEKFAAASGGAPSIAPSAPAQAPAASQSATFDCSDPLKIETPEHFEYCAQNLPKFDTPRR